MYFFIHTTCNLRKTSLHFAGTSQNLRLIVGAISLFYNYNHAGMHLTKVDAHRAGEQTLRACRTNADVTCVSNSSWAGGAAVVGGGGGDSLLLTGRQTD